MKKHKRMLSLLCAIVLAVTLMAPTALALQGPDVSVPDNYDLIYFVDCGAGAFPANIQTLLAEHTDTVENANTPDQAYDGTWGYTNATDDLEVRNSDSDDIYQSIRNFKSGKNGQTLEYKFAGDAGEYRVFVGLYDIWHMYNNGVRQASVSVNGGAAQSLTYGSDAHLLSFDATVADGNGLSVKVVPTNTAAGDEGDVLVSFIMVTKKAQEPAEPQKPEAPTADTSIWGKGGENWKLDIVSTCTNPDAAHVGGNTDTEHKNFISGKYFAFGEMRLNNGVWEVSAEFDAMDYLDEKFGAPHAAQNVSLTLEYVNNKWCIQTDGEKAVINLVGSCAVSGPEAPVLGENLEVWVQIYSGEYAPKRGSRIDGNTSTYGSSVTFGDVEKTGEQWTCDMTVVGYTKDSNLSDNCYLNKNMPKGYEVDPYELDRDGNAKKTVTLTYNQENGKWECPAIPLKHTSTGPASTSTVKYGVSFKIKNTTEAEGAPALPVDNPVHNGGFWVSLYVYAEETGYEEVYTQVYDGTQDYVHFSAPAEGEGILGTYATTATVDGNKVLAASGLKGYELADRKPIKDNELVFDWDSMTWTAQTMTPYFDQPGSTIAKRGLAFLVQPIEDPAPPLPVPGETAMYFAGGEWVSVTYTCTNENAVHKPANTKTRNLTSISKQYLKAVGDAQQDETGLWTCQVTLDAAALLSGTSGFNMAHTGEDLVLTAVYNETRSRWELPAEPLTFTGTCTQNGPEAPSTSNCTDFYVTVYGYEPQVDETVKNISLSSFRWDVANSRVTITFSQPEKNDQGVWTCEATIQAEDWVEEVYQSKLSSHYRRDDTDPTTKTITLTFDQGKGKWVAESDGITYGYPSNPSTKNGVAFRLVKQYTVTYTPGRDLTGRIPEGENVFGGAYDKGAEVQLPQTTGFVTENGVFAGWEVTIQKYINDPDSVTYFYPLGTETMPMFGKDVELEAYWMDVVLNVASVPYDETLSVSDYTFGNAANFVIDGDTVTVLYRAQVQGNSQYPYALTVHGPEAAAVYGSQLSGTIDKYQTSKYVYFTVTYTAEEFEAMTQQTVELGNGATAAASVTVTVEHQVEAVAYVAPTCTEEGSKAYWHCTSCGKYFADAACTQEITEDIDTWKVIPAIGHAYGEPAFQWSADGKTCTVTFTCGNDAAHVETLTAEITSNRKTAPTCTEKGVTVYTAKVTFEGKDYTDTLELTDIPATGHAYGEPTFQWSEDGKTCTATFTCGNDETHVETLDAEVTSAVKTAPTCTEMGVTTYTAQVTFQDETYTNTLELTDIPATGHAYGEPTFQWSEDGKTCTATFTCGNDASHVEVLNAQVTSAVKTAPTCTEMGVTTYTAKVTFQDETYTNTLELTDIPATGHAYGEPTFQWSEDGKTCTATFTCGNDASHVEVLNAQVTSAVKTAPTCTEMGVTAYTAKVTFQDQDYTDTLELTDIPATGHAYGEPAFQWSADGKTCTVTFTCGNDAAHVETLTAEITSNLKTAPTCTEKGVTVYTAKVTFEGKDYTATLELTDIPAAGHHYEDGVCTVCGEKDPDYVEPTTEPTKPATDPDGPDQTGDTTPVALLMSLLLISAACLTAVIAKSRKIRF